MTEPFIGEMAHFGFNFNPRGWAFWRREGFRETGVNRFDAETGHVLHRLVKDLGRGAG